MAKNTKLSSSDKVKIPIQGEDKLTIPRKEDLGPIGFKIPEIDTTALKNGLVYIAAPLVSILAALYVFGLVGGFILYPVRFIALIVSILSSFIKFIF